MKAPILEPSKLERESLWQTEGANLKAGAAEFAARYWAQSRKVRDWAQRSDGSATFSIAGGMRTYVAEFKRGTFGTLVVVSYVVAPATPRTIAREGEGR